jgi:membrane-bound serine protease (ClpP class)
MISQLQHVLAQLSPNAAVLLLTLGLALIYFELNRPGTIIPGSLGLLATLLAFAALAPHGFNPLGIISLLLSIALLTLDLIRPTPDIVAAFACSTLVYGFIHLLAHPCCSHISTPVAIGCGLLLGIGTSVLTRIARRARANKGLD